jgi:hypothetical protein
MTISQKVPFSNTINRFSKNKIENQLQNLGQALPCSVVSVSGAIVTVTFEVNVPEGITLPQVTCPIAESQYTRLPIQPGDKGVVMGANARLGGISGLGLGLADLVNPTNLGGLIFVPIGNKNWFNVDGKYLFMYGVNGVELTTINQDCTLILNSSGISINLNGGTLNISNGSVIINGNIQTTGTLTNNGVNISSTHEHSGVQTGSGNTGTPI